MLIEYIFTKLVAVIFKTVVLNLFTNKIYVQK